MPEGEGMSQGWSAVGWAGSWLQSPGVGHRSGSEGPTSSESVNSAPPAQAMCCWPR